MEINKHVEVFADVVCCYSTLHTSISCLNKQSHHRSVDFWGCKAREIDVTQHTKQSIYVEWSLDVNEGLVPVPLFTHLAFVSQSIFMINFFSCATQKCVRLSSFFSWLRQSHMFLIFVYLRSREWQLIWIRRILKFLIRLLVKILEWTAQPFLETKLLLEWISF